MKWNDLKRENDKLFILGFAPTTRHLAPFGNTSYDAWALNEEYNYDWTWALGEDKKPIPNKFKHKFNLWFQMHPRWDFSRNNNNNHFNHPNWLYNKESACLRCNGEGHLIKQDTKEHLPCPECENGKYTPPEYRIDLPIVMQKSWEDVPNSVAYPLKEASDVFGLGYPYFTSSVSFMLALAYLMGYKQVDMYGFEMGTDTEYHYQRANGEYVIGFLQAKGMKINLPQESPILKGQLYGYVNMKTGFRQNLEMRHVMLSKQEGEQVAKVNQLAGQVLLLDEMQKQAEINIPALLEKKSKDYDKAKGLHNVVKGAMAETKNLTGLYDKFYMSGSEGGDLHSAEDFAAFTNTEYSNG